MFKRAEDVAIVITIQATPRQVGAHQQAQLSTAGHHAHHRASVSRVTSFATVTASARR